MFSIMNVAPRLLGTAANIQSPTLLHTIPCFTTILHVYCFYLQGGSEHVI